MEKLFDKARAKFHGILHVLNSSRPLKTRISVFNTVVFETSRQSWVVGVPFPTAQQQTLLNSVQYVRLGTQDDEAEAWKR